MRDECHRSGPLRVVIAEADSLAPVLLGSGTRLFDHLGGQVQLERTDVVPTANATHLRYRVVR